MTTKIAHIDLGGIRVVAPRDLAELAGWTFHTTQGADVVQAHDATTNRWASRRIVRAISELKYTERSIIEGTAARAVLARCVELGDIESLEGKRDNARLAVAKLEAQAAADRLRAAELEYQPREG